MSVVIVPAAEVIEATAKALWNFEEQRMVHQDASEGRRYQPCLWTDAHELDRAEYTEKALAVIHAYESARAASSRADELEIA